MQFDLFAKIVGKMRDDTKLEICNDDNDPDKICLNSFDEVTPLG